MVSAIILAAGSGVRFGRLKQFETLAGARLVDHVVTTAASVAHAVVVVLPAGVAWDGAPVYAAVPGGPTRSASVRAGLAALPPATEVVVIHDAVHPLAGRNLFEAVIERVRRGAEAAVPVIPATDTPAQCKDDRLVALLPGDGAVLIQIPHAFRLAVLREAYGAGIDARDEASLLVRAGRVVHTVPGDLGNIHITRPEELEVARRLFKANVGSHQD